MLTITLQDSDTVTHKKRFLPLLPDISQQRQTKPVSTNESDFLLTSRFFNKEPLNLLTSGRHAKRHTFIPLLPDRDTSCPQQGLPSHGANTGSVSPESPLASALNTKWPSHEQGEHVAKAAAQKKNVHSTRSKTVRLYEWPLIINGVYQGEGPLPSCRIEDNESPAESKPYAWPIIILHRARSEEDCDQQPGRNDEEANENTGKGEGKVEGFKTDDKITDESEMTDGFSAER